MRYILWLMLSAAIASCGALSREDSKIKMEDAHESATLQKMIVAKGDQVPGHPALIELGQVQGICGRAPIYDDDPSSASIGFKHAAYEKFGDKVDGIIKVDTWFVIGNGASAVEEPGSSEGHFECRGIAVHFAQS
jgi:hypothetical protein